jgi:hypothetical protein
VTALSKVAKDLKHQEEIIQDGMQSFLHVGRALIAIRDESLYEEKYETFEAYCKQRWGFTARRAYQFIESAETVSDLRTIVHTGTAKNEVILPSNEAQARALASSADDAEDRAKVWQAAVEAAPKNSAGEPVVTAKIVKEAAEELFGPPKSLDEQQESNGRPSAGTSFDPSEFDPDVESGKAESRDDIPKHLAGVLAGVAQYKALQREVSLIYGKVESLAKLPIGSYIQLQEIETHIKQVKADLKAYSFGDNCPLCQNKPKEKCERCKGRGWLAHSQMGRLSDFDKQWLETNSVKP